MGQSTWVQHPNSYFMDVKCPGCYKITTVFSHAQIVVLCVVAPQSFVSPLVAGQGSQKDVPLGRSNTKEYLRPPTNSRVGTVTRSIPKMPQRNCSALDSYWRKIFFIHYLQ